jgi:hypothetical protein
MAAPLYVCLSPYPPVLMSIPVPMACYMNIVAGLLDYYVGGRSHWRGWVGVSHTAN